MVSSDFGNALTTLFLSVIRPLFLKTARPAPRDLITGTGKSFPPGDIPRGKYPAATQQDSPPETGTFFRFALVPITSARLIDYLVPA